MRVCDAILLGAGGLSMFTPGQVALLGAAFLGIALMSASARRRRRDRQQTPEAYLREHVRRVKEERVVVNDAEAVARRLEQFAREMHAQIQTHIARLEGACRDADRRIAALGGQPVGTLPGNAVCPPIGNSVDPAIGQAFDVVVADASDVSPSTVAAAPLTAPPGATRDELRRTALRLSEEGHDVRHIAAAMKRSVGEVELLIAAARVRPRDAATAST